MRITHGIVLTGTALLAFPQLPFAAPAEKSHVASEQVNRAVQELGKLAQKKIQENAVPGLAIAVVFQDKVVYAKGFGLRDVNTKAPVDADTVFQLASVSKPIGSDNGLAIVQGPKKMTFAMKHYDRDMFTYETAGENAVGKSGITFTIGPDGRATQVMVENLNVHGEGTFKRESTAQATRQSSVPLPTSGEVADLVEIGNGRKMYLECRGSGSPTVILESGYRNDADIWSAQLEPGMTTVFPQVAKFTRVCAYDRPGTFLDGNHLSRSTPVPMPRTARDLVSDLHALLEKAHVPGPYVFAAHSFGGIFARLYASTYPNDVVGMVLVDALSEKVKSGLTPEQWKLYVNFGFTKPTPGVEKYKDIETLDANASLDQMKKAASAEPLRPMPLFVLTQGQPFDLTPWQPLPADFPGALDKAWHTAQDELATLAPNARHRVATKSAHYIQVQEPQLVVDAIKQVVEAVRNPPTWTAAR